jgi:hypothetical protein
MTGRGEGYCILELPERGQPSRGLAGLEGAPVRPGVLAARWLPTAAWRGPAFGLGARVGASAEGSGGVVRVLAGAGLGAEGMSGGNGQPTFQGEGGERHASRRWNWTDGQRADDRPRSRLLWRL